MDEMVSMQHWKCTKGIFFFLKHLKMHTSPCWLNWLTCFLLPVSNDTLWSTHTHPYDLLFIPISSPRREWWSQEQCKLGKMFWKVAFPAGTSQLQLWVKTLCVCVGVRAPIVLLVLECMKVCVCPDVHVCLLFPISHRLRWAVILGLVESETKRESVYKAKQWWKLRASLCQTSPISW